MCGIFFLTQIAKEYNRGSVDKIKAAFQSGAGRGPDNYVFTENFYANPKYHHPVGSNYDHQHYFHLGFHRLSINGLDEGSNQPLIVDGVALICNGEIYNYKELYEEHGITPQTHSDCEVIIHLYLKYGIEQTLQLIHGVFAFVLIDDRNLISNTLSSLDKEIDKHAANIISYAQTTSNADNYVDMDVEDGPMLYDRKVIVARDSYGIRPMFFVDHGDRTFGVASLLKQLQPLCESPYIKASQFKPGTYKSFYYNFGNKIAEAHYDFKDQLLLSKNIPLNNDDVMAACFNVHKYLSEAVKMRVETTDRPVACLLSGGLDSSLITALVAKYVPDPKLLNTFSIGMAGGSDLEHARTVANHLGTNHHEIIVTEDDFFEAIPNVIKAIESYDTTTVRASVGNYLVGKYISEHCDAKVIFNGDGSDELFGGYLYMHCAPNNEAFAKETRQLLNYIHYFDVLRSDRCISCHGLEPRTPFMDVNLIGYYLSVSAEVRNHRATSKLPEKYILRKAFSRDNLIPDSVLWRTKEAFSDGVSNEGNSWHTIIKRRLEKDMANIISSPNYVEGLTLEQNYYRQIFDREFPNSHPIIPYYWMPNFVNTNDCSARSLGIYNELKE